MRNAERLAAILCTTALVFFLVQQAFLGLRSSPAEVDSLTYHIPIARHILQHGWWSVPQIEQGWGYYPAAGETILALLLSIHPRLSNLFNVLAIGLVFLVSTSLGRAFGLRRDVAVVFAAAVALLQPAMRLVNNQTVDVWFQLFVLAAVLFLHRMKKGSGKIVLVGLALGLLSATKYSGPFVALAVLVTYRSEVASFKLKELLIGLVPLLAVGGYFYLRNFLLTGNPFYPANISLPLVHLRGEPGNRLAEWNPLKTILFYPKGTLLFVEAFISEYAVWLIFLGYFVFVLFRLVFRKGPSASEVVRLTILGLLLNIMFLVTPSWPRNLVSDLRYTLGGMSLLILALFLHFSKSNPMLPILATLTSLMLTFPLLTHHPKVNVAVAVLLLFAMRLKLPKTSSRPSAT